MTSANAEANEVLRAMESRRSVRRYSGRQVPDEDIERILWAASFSPNAGNRQTTQVVVCQDAELNDRLGRINRAAFRGRISDAQHFISRDQPSIADDPTIPSAFYGAPTVITLFGPRGFLYAEADCWIFASAIALAAHSLGVGSCLLGRAEDTFTSELGISTQRAWGIAPDKEARAHVTLGYLCGDGPRGKSRTYPNPIVVR